MYTIPHFTEQDINAVVTFIREHPFVTLIGCEESIATATQIPLLIDTVKNDIIVRGHFMRGTDHHRVFTRQPETLLLFTGPQCYVSAGWYDERGHGSTWNYMTVQAKGRLEFYDDEQTIELLRELTHHFEDHQLNPELLENMANEYVRSHVKAIAGFQMKLYDIRATFKLSQNRNDESYRNIVRQLETIGKPQELLIAEEMRKRRPHLF